MNDSLISVVIPTYNRERYLPEAIESVLTQDYAPIELIVVDDGSTDDTPAVIERYAGRLRSIRQENQGISAARNAGVALARGEFLAFLDDDDIWSPDKLTRQMAVLSHRTDIHVVYGHTEQFFSPELDSEFTEKVRSQAGLLPAPMAGSMLIRKEAFLRVGLFNPKFSIGIEMDWLARAQEAGITSVMLPDVLFRRRIHRSNFNIRFTHKQSERLHVLKAVLDRRRCAKPQPAQGS